MSFGKYKYVNGFFVKDPDYEKNMAREIKNERRRNKLPDPYAEDLKENKSGAQMKTTKGE